MKNKAKCNEMKILTNECMDGVVCLVCWVGVSEVPFGVFIPNITLNSSRTNKRLDVSDRRPQLLAEQLKSRHSGGLSHSQTYHRLTDHSVQTDRTPISGLRSTA